LQQLEHRADLPFPLSGFANTPGQFGWRMPLAIQAILILITLICLIFTPESPRYLIEVGRKEEGFEIIRRFHGEEYAAAAMVEIEQAIALEHATAVKGWSSAFANNGQGEFLTRFAARRGRDSGS